MKKINFLFFAMLLLFSTITFAQQKTPPAPPELKVAPPLPEIRPEKPVLPTPSDINGHPWTRNGQTVWVVKPPKPVQPPKPPKPPIPPLPPLPEEVNKKALRNIEGL